MENLPLVSVIVPTYNSGRFLSEALHSVMGQTYCHWECIVVDDGSTDSSAEQAATFCEKDSRFSLLQKNNGGLASARNAGIDNSKGDLIAFLDSDDKWDLTKLFHHVTLLNSNSVIGITYSWTRFIDDNGYSLRFCRKPLVSNLSDYYLFCRNPITNGSNGVFRRSVFLTHRFDEQLSHNQDVDCWLRIAFTIPRRWEFQGIPKLLTFYRVNSMGLSNNYQAHYKCAKIVWSNVSAYNPTVAARFAGIAEAFQLRFYCRRAIASKDYKSARYFIIKAVRKDFRIMMREPLSTFVTLIASFIHP